MLISDVSESKSAASLAAAELADNARRNRTNIVRSLLEAGVPKNRADSEGKTALMLACDWVLVK